MVKKIVALFILVGVFSGCEGVISSKTEYAEVVDLAYSTTIQKNNKNGYGFTFTAPNHSSVDSSSKYSSSVEIADTKYSIYVDSALYLEDKNLVTRTPNGEYVLVTQDIEDQHSNMLFEYRRILLVDDPELTIAENQEAAQKVLDGLNKTENQVANFEEYAIKHSGDTATSSNGGYIGPVNATQVPATTLPILYGLQNNTFHNELVAVDGGYELIMLIAKYEMEEIATIDEDAVSDRFVFKSKEREFTTYVINNENDTFSVVTKNDYISISAMVFEEDIRAAIYNTIVVARSIRIHEEIVLDLLINPVSSSTSSEIFDLNAVNIGLSTKISTEYNQPFSTSLSEGVQEEDKSTKMDSFEFDTRPLTEEEEKLYKDELPEY